MGVEYEFSSTTLLCPEDSNSVDDDDCVTGEEWEGRDHKNVGFCENFFMDFPLLSDECLTLMVLKGTHHMPRGDYPIRLQNGAVDVSVRNEAIDWIWKVHSRCNFKPLTFYLSVNYLDRFLSHYELPQGKAWMSQLLSVACLSLAAKMEETEMPLSLDLQAVESKYEFEARTIKRMELLVLSTLKWRMLAVTPFSFIRHFLEKINGDEPPPKTLMSKSEELILKTITRIEFLKFKPSEIAAAVALSVSGQSQFMDDDEKVLSSCIHVDKERTMECYVMIRSMPLMRSWSLSPVPQSPIGVLDAACVSYNSDTAFVSQASSYHTSPDAKKRRVMSKIPTSSS